VLPLLLAATAALAADATSLAPFKRGDVELRHDSQLESMRLVEAGETVGERMTATHHLTLGADFSFAPGAALFVDLPIYFSDRVAFASGREMTFDPNTDSGTYIDASALDIDPFDKPGVQGSGVGGVWVGLHGTPFSQDFARRDRATLLLELAFRTPDKTNFWTADESGKRGAGPGASALRLGMAASTTLRNTEPYTAFAWERVGALSTDVRDETGALLASAMEIDPASSATATVGTETTVWRDADSGGQVSLDFHLDLGYRSWQDIPSGLYLPSVLDASRTVPVTQSDAVFLEGGAGMHYRIIEYVQLGLGGTVGTISPYRIEHPYAVSSGVGTLGWGVHGYLRFRARDPLFDR
jgi:hypothetical protein